MDFNELARDAKRARELGDIDLELAILRKIDALKSAEPPPNPATDYGGLPLRPFGVDTGVTMPVGVSNYLAGAGAGLSNLWRGVKQTVGAESSQDVREAAARDAPLMDTGAGIAGNLTGRLLPMLGTAFIPGANSVTGAAGIGAVTGALAPTSDDNVLAGKAESALFGGLLGGGTIAAGKALHGGYNAVKGLIEPFTDAGQSRIVGRALRTFATNADDAANSASRASASVPGYRPTLQEATQDPGLAGLQRGLMNLPEPAAQIGAVERSNVVALKDAIGRIAGDDAAMAAAKGARESATDALYSFADNAVLPVNDELRALLNRNVIKSAIGEAKKNASNRGEQLLVQLTKKTKGITGKTLHSIKRAIDDAYESTKQSQGASSEAAKSIAKAKADYLAWVESRIPSYGQARETFAEMSRPINQMQIGGLLADKLGPALDDFAQTGVVRPGLFAESLRNPDRLVKQATGNSGRLGDIMDPEQLASINNVGKALANRASAQNLGRPVGTNTAQNLASQNLIRQIAGPLGLPQSFMEAQFWPTVMRPVNFALKSQEPAITGKMAEAMIDPQLAARLMRAGVPKEKIGPLLQQIARYGAMPGLLSVNSTQQ